MIDGQPPSRPNQPRPETVAVSKLVEALVGADEGLLRDVLSVLMVAHDAVSHPHREPATVRQTRLELAREVARCVFPSARQERAGQPIRELVTVNGVRVTVEDGTWGLVRASSNKPELVVVVESPVSEQRMREMFKAVDGVLRTHPEVGAYNQTI
jgi:phosphomannomutase